MLEVSVPKPGNVSFGAVFEGTRVEHFLASAVAAGPAFYKAASQGVSVAEGQLELGEVGVGEIIKFCTAEIAAWQHGGNTILGTVMLLVPLAAAAGMTKVGNGYKLDFSELRRNLNAVVHATSALDAVHLYEAVDIALPSGLGDTVRFDLKDPDSKKKLLKDNVTLFEVFKIAAEYDDICYEWINNYPVTFDLAYPTLMEQLQTKTLHTAVQNTFLTVLAARPDTFIARKMGKAKAVEVSAEAKEVLALDVETVEGKAALAMFDSELRRRGNMCNPGTTADLVAVTLALCTLGGYRP